MSTEGTTGFMDDVSGHVSPFRMNDVPEPDYENRENRAAIKNANALYGMQERIVVVVHACTVAVSIYAMSLLNQRQERMEFEILKFHSVVVADTGSLPATASSFQEIELQDNDEVCHGRTAEPEVSLEHWIAIEVEEGQILSADQAYILIRQQLMLVMQSSEKLPSKIRLVISGVAGFSQKEGDALIEQAREEVMHMQIDGPTA